ncbi:MAG: hypothetical protein B7Z75_06320 [Acidocella sp. 20-57-95]|nr:MAG: hypothetical protein B7Z75_06320 [Acidocella sp. 20-57-95]HQT64756.1 hypothetical protein [Acidocella sp.]
MDREDIVVAVVAAAGGTLTSRVRLQKTIYLLDQLNLKSGFSFEYYHYGPFSRDLDNATADAKALGKIKEDIRHRQSDGAAFSVFSLCEEQNAKAHGELGAEQITKLTREFSETNVTVLELAATINWLCEAEHCADWNAEVTKRKGVKVQGGKLQKAVELLTKIGLSPRPIEVGA